MFPVRSALSLGWAIAEVEARRIAQSLQQEIDTLASDKRVQTAQLYVEKPANAMAVTLAPVEFRIQMMQRCASRFPNQGLTLMALRASTVAP